MRNYLLGTAGIAIAVAMVSPAAAQETTSSIRGSVTAAGAPVAGATVTITHVPSGTRSTATTDAAGSFNSTGLRVGGPFTVAVEAPGYSGATVTDINTVIGQPFELPVELAAQGDAIVVTASRLVNARTVSQGPATILTAETIANVASVNRDVRDLMRRDPFARIDYASGSGRAVSFAGQNARLNRFTVDGVPITDNFGLNPDGLPTRRSPVPFDSIAQFQTKVAPYDIREGNFQGGVINAILKSGSNEFHGTGFYAYGADELTGDRTKAGPGVPTGRITLPNFKYENYGGEISGPIIKDKLFFMVAGERIRFGQPIPEGTAGNNAGTVIQNLTDAQVSQIQSIAKSRYGYDTGGILNNNNDRDDRLVAKIDANLAEGQRLALTYLYTKDSILFSQNAVATGNPSLGLESNGYRATNRLHAGVAQLNSEWSDEFSTEVRGFYKDYKRGQDPILGRGFAQFSVCAAQTSDRANPGSAGSGASTSCAPGFATVAFGPDISRQFNALTSKTWGGQFVARLTQNDHDLRIFADMQSSEIYNAFLQRTAGDYYFDSIADFQAGNAQRLRYQNAVPSLDPNNAAAEFKYQTYTFGIQDSWRIDETLTVVAGMRYDLYGGNSRPATNQNFINRYGFPNTAYISGRGLFQPRIGFDFKPAPRLSFRGGIGIFGGGSPDVYVSNSFSNTGFLSNSIDIRQNNDGSYTVAGLAAAAAAAAGSGSLVNVNGTTIPAAANAALLNASTSALSTTNALDPNFKLPSQWRGTLSADYKLDLGGLGDGWNFGADFFWSSVRNQVYFTDLRTTATALRTPDGRVRGTGVTAFTDTGQDIFLTNTKKGRSYIAVARLDKAWDFGLSAGIAYSYQDVKDQAPATSSTAGSNYSNGAFVDFSGAAYGIANEQTRHQVKFNLSYDHAFFGDYKTRFSLFGESRIGRPYSWTMQDTSQGRSAIFGNVGTSARYLLYVPTSATDALVTYDNPTTAAYLDNLINTTGLKKYRGKVAPRNAFNNRWFTRLDLHVGQELPTGLGSSRVEVFMDIENFTNFLNKNWGQIREYAFPYTQVAVRVQCLQTAGGAATTSTTQPCAQYRYSAPNATPSTTISSRESLYSIRVGARFTF